MLGVDQQLIRPLALPVLVKTKGVLALGIHRHGMTIAGTIHLGTSGQNGIIRIIPGREDGQTSFSGNLFLKRK
jgi:hypothetical protein